MERKEVESSLIKSVGYNAEEQILELEFKNSGAWEYFDFPQEKFDEMMSEGQSIGKYFLREIKKKYQERQSQLTDKQRAAIAEGQVVS